MRTNRSYHDFLNNLITVRTELSRTRARLVVARGFIQMDKIIDEITKKIIELDERIMDSTRLHSMRDLDKTYLASLPVCDSICDSKTNNNGSGEKYDFTTSHKNDSV